MAEAARIRPGCECLCSSVKARAREAQSTCGLAHWLIAYCHNATYLHTAGRKASSQLLTALTSPAHEVPVPMGSEEAASAPPPIGHMRAPV